jgi:hypothetical protein
MYCNIPYVIIHRNPIPVAAIEDVVLLSLAYWYCGFGIPRGRECFAFCDYCVLSGFPLRRAGHSSREFLQRVFCLSVISKTSKLRKSGPSRSVVAWER